MTFEEHLGGMVRLAHGDSRDVLKALPDNSVDSVVTDPPYALVSIVKRFGGEGAAPAKVGASGAYARASAGFMGQTWDTGETAFAVEFWAEVMRVLKPGGHVIAASGTRTYHRLACAIEDAGFEIRDMISWLYGCVDDETEALTRRGWLRHDELRGDDEVMQWNASTGALSWASPGAINRAPYRGDMVRLTNRHTDQLLTPNHRVYAKVCRHARNGVATEYEVIEAGAIRRSWHADLPMAGLLRGGGGPEQARAYLVGWWMTDAWAHGDGRACMFSQSKPVTRDRLRNALAPYQFSEYVKPGRKDTHAAEHTFYVTGELAEYLLSNFSDRRLTWEMLSWSLEARTELIAGLMDGDGSVKGESDRAWTFWSMDAERRAIFMALVTSIGYRTHEGAEKGAVYFNIGKSSTQIQARHRVAPEHYEGVVWCVTVPDGAFVCRRRGGVFITGNSGFPKSHNVGKGIDASLIAGSARTTDMRKIAMGEDYEPSGRGRVNFDHGGGSAMNGAAGGDLQTDEARQWQGFGTALKPACEPWVLARKPLIGTVAANVLAHGTGALNIDGCRVEAEAGGRPAREVAAMREGVTYGGNSLAGRVDGSLQSSKAVGTTEQGRFPANVIHDGSDEVVGAFPDSNGQQGAVGPEHGANPAYGGFGPRPHTPPRHDSGSAARFFYSAKADAMDRVGSKHPTVKPVDLMQYLCRLITPPGGTVLDPFAGSGTTGEAAYLEGFRCILIEREAEYAEDIRARLALAASGTATRKRAIAARKSPTVKDDGAGQVGLFG